MPSDDVRRFLFFNKRTADMCMTCPGVDVYSFSTTRVYQYVVANR